MQRVEPCGMDGRQIDRWAVSRGMNGTHQGVKGLLHPLPEGLCLAVVTVDQPLRLAREVRPTA